MITCTDRCQEMTGAFQSSALIPAIRGCRSCGQPRRRELAPAAPPPGAPAVPQGVLCTIGSAGLRLEQFLRTMQERQIELLADTRWNAAWSEHPGRSLDTLRRASIGHQVAYRHLAMLGSLPAMRHRFKADCGWAAFVSAHEAVLASQETVLGRVAAYARTHRLCFGDNHNTAKSRTQDTKVVQASSKTSLFASNEQLKSLGFEDCEVGSDLLGGTKLLLLGSYKVCIGVLLIYLS